MQIVPEILKKVELAGAKLIAVTKYFSPSETENIREKLQKESVVFAFGENRIADIKNKSFPRKELHFIGNIQSRDISNIAKYCSVIHSLCKVKHAEMFSKQDVVPEIFIQINISCEENKAGILSENLGQFLQEISSFNLTIVGISAIGAGEFTEEAKRAEFRALIALRDTFLPGKSISAGTSRDFEIALEEGIDVVRVGQGLFNEALKS